MPDFDPEMLDRIAQGSIEDRDALAEQVLAESRALLDNLNKTQQRSVRDAEALFKAIDYATSNPFELPENVPALDAHTYNQQKEIATGQSRAWDIAEINAKNYAKAEKVEAIYTEAALTQSQTRVKQQQIVNEGYRLNQMVEAGNLINAKTEGIQIQSSMQAQQNLTGRKLVEIEAQKGQALIQGAIIEVEQIQTENNSRLIASQKDFDSMRNAGIGVSISANAY